MNGTTNVFPQDGNVGIGTTSPDGKLTVAGGQITINDANAGAGALQLGAVGVNPAIWGWNLDNPLLFGSASGKVSFSGDCNVGIGTIDPQAKLEVNGNVQINYESDATLNEHHPHSIKMKGDDHAFYMGVDTDTRTGYMQSTDWLTGQSNIALNPLGGNVGIGTTSPQAKLDVNGNIEIHGNIKVFGNVDIMGPNTGIRWDGADANSIKQYDNPSYIQFKSSGNTMAYYYNGNTSVFSDRSLKKNFNFLNGATSQLSQLAPFTFDYRAEMMPKGLLPGGTHYGVDAGEVQKLFPHLVKEVSHPTNSDEKYLTVNYTEFVPILIQAVNEQQETIDKLINRIEALENQADK